MNAGNLDQMLAWRHLAVVGILGVACSFELDLEDNAVPITVAFEFTMSGADEASGTITVPVILSRPAEQEVTVDYSLLGGNNAMPGVDFELVTGKLVFAVGEYRRELPVTIKSDTDETEMAETFDIALSAPTGAVLDETRAIHSVRISDHILPRVLLAATPTTSSEGTPSNLTIMLDKPSEGQSTVVVGFAGGVPAPASTSDLTIVDGTQVVIPNGATMVTVPIGEKDDTLDEEDSEVAVFTLRGASPNLVLGATKTLDHRITDNDDPPLVRFTSATGTIQENGVLRTVNISLSTQSGRQVRVDYIRDAGDTADDADATVTGSPSTLTFDPGQTTKTIAILIDNDSVDEDNETVVVNLANAVNATINTGTHTLTIQDNDTSTVTFQNTGTTVDEDTAGRVMIMVRLSTVSSKTVTVPFSVNGGMTSATNNDDYTLVTASPLVFAPGVTQLPIEVDVFDNSPGNENDERVVLDIGTPTNAPRGNPSRFTLTITE